ncbi:MAG: hypothetical protein AAF736_01650 [Pseudomonadota bacterium]
MQALPILLLSLLLSSQTVSENRPSLDCNWLKLAAPQTECTLAGGWQLAALGQQTGDPGYYRFALAIGRRFRRQPRLHTEAVLLEGYSLQQLHRFDDAYRVVEPLLAIAPIAAVYQLLGDIRLEQGLIDQAAAYYQQQLNLKPSPSAYARGAQVRYLSGDVEGALSLLELALEGATRSSDVRELAFALRLGGRFLLTKGESRAASRMLVDSVRLMPSPSSRLLLARAQLASGQRKAACSTLLGLIDTYPAPDAVAWFDDLAACPGQDGLRQALRGQVGGVDARGYARYLLLEARETAMAAELLEGELRQRRDPLTLALAAWADLDLGYAAAAELKIREALATGYPEPLPYLVGAMVAAQREDAPARERHLVRLSRQIFLLSPREREIYARLKDSALQPQKL